MTQLFAGGERLGDPGTFADMIGTARPMIRQRPPADDTDFGPALTAGKGLRPVRCIGCSEATLPRTGDGAPLCARCSDLLEGSQQRSSSPFGVRWWRRR